MGAWQQVGTKSIFLHVQAFNSVLFKKKFLSRESKSFYDIFSAPLPVEKDGEDALWNVRQEITDVITEVNQTCTPCVIWEYAPCGEQVFGARYNVHHGMSH